jgi:endonuclease/exonuclease/phosphatase family metal-dependent hydrolase
MIRVEVKVGNTIVNFATTHLDYQYEDGRVFETEQLLKFLQRVRGPLIVLGDFNDEPSGSAYKLMLRRFQDAWTIGKAKEAGLSYPADKPAKRIVLHLHATGGSHTNKASMDREHACFRSLARRR